MSLVGFKAQNHEQQVLVRGPRSHVDDRATTPEDFAPWHERFRFTIDAAAAPHNAKLPRFWTIADDGLAQDWTGERVYCNPPYSSIEPWCEKAHRSGAELVVMLLPANRTEQGWWQRQIEPQRRASTVTVEFLPGRLRFLKPGQKHIAPNERPPFGCCLVIWGLDRPSVDAPGAGGWRSGASWAGSGCTSSTCPG
jgi:phage N-6-adenine-methyltransferase